MATRLPLTRLVSASTVGLALVGAVLVGPASLGDFAGPAASFAIPAVEPTPPLPPDPVPDVQAPVNQGPANFEGPPIRHRRHLGDPVR